MQVFYSPLIAPYEGLRPTGRRLQVFVLFTGKDSTSAALRTAARFVYGLGGEIIIAVTQIVPYPLSLNHPPVDRGILINQIADCVSQSGLTGETSPKVLVVYARDFGDGCRFILPPHCIVFVGNAHHSPWRRFRSWNAARFLRKRGHEVLLAS